MIIGCAPLAVAFVAAIVLTSPALAQTDAHTAAIAVVERSGVADNLNVILRTSAPLTMTGRIARAHCSEIEWETHLGAAIEGAIATHGPAWNEANAQILVKHVEPQQITAALNYEPKRMQIETFGTLPPQTLQSALDESLKPILEPALLDTIAYLFEHCGAPSP